MAPIQAISLAPVLSFWFSLFERTVAPHAREAKKSRSGCQRQAPATPLSAQNQQSTLLKRGNVGFPPVGEYTAGCSAIALPRLITAGLYFGNSFTLQRIRNSCLPKRGVEDANVDGEIWRRWRYIASSRDI
jgi:hypothetical protein